MDIKRLTFGAPLILGMVLTFMLTPLCSVFSQVSVPGTPLSYDASQPSGLQQKTSGYKVKKADIKKRINNAIEKENAERRADSLDSPMKPYGVGIDVTIDVLKEAEINTLPDGGKLYLIEIGSGGALGLQLHFSRFRLPAGARMYIYNKAMSMKLGAYTKINNNANGEFAIQIIKGDTLTLEYYEPKNPEFKSEIKIKRVIHVYGSVFRESGGGGIGQTGFDDSGDCNINVNCEPTYSNESKAVTRFTVYDHIRNTSGFMSGSLINSVSHKNYVLTANHAYYSPAAPDQYFSDWIFYFNYEFSGCTSSSVEPDNTKTMQGAFLRSKGALSDYMLLELPLNPKNYYPVNYLGWDVGGLIPNVGVACIHHPYGDTKKISLSYSESPITIKTELNPGSETNFHDVPNGLPVTDFKLSWDEGITQRGSSGAPLIDMQSKRIIGQVHGGNSSCLYSEVYYNGPDYFGMLSTSWIYPDSGFPTLKSLLAGSTSPLTELNGDYNGAGVVPYVNIRDIILSTNSFELPKNKLVPTIETSGTVGTLSYEWSPAADFSYPNLREGVITFGYIPPTLPLTRTYTLRVIPQFGTGSTRSVAVTLYDCQNRTFNKNVHLNTDIQLGKPGATGETYSWSPSTNLSNASIANPVFKATTQGSYSYTMTATSAGCTRTEKYVIYGDDQPTGTSLVTGIINQKAQYASPNFVYPDGIFQTGMIRLKDGSYIVPAIFLGDGYNNDDDKVELIKLDASFNVVLRKTFDVTFLNFINKLKETSDGGFVLTGSDKINKGYGEALPDFAKVIKFDANLNSVWTYQKAETFMIDHFGSYVTDIAYEFEDVVQTLDGGFAVIANIVDYYYYSDADEGRYEIRQLIKLNAVGNYESILTLESNKFFASDYYTRQMSDGSFIVVGEYLSDIKNVRRFTYSGSTFTQVWSKSIYDGVNKNLFCAMETVNDNTFVLGTVVTGDFRILKMNSTGDILWDRRYGGAGSDYLTSITKLSTGGFMIGGRSYSAASGHKSENSRGEDDYWIIKLDESGNNLGDNTFGGSKGDRLTKLFELGNGLYTLIGTSLSPISGEKTMPLTSPYKYSYWWLQIQEGACTTPQATISASGSTFLCPGQSVTLTANDGANLSYKWYGGGKLMAQTRAITVTSNNAAEYVVIISKPNSCATTASTLVSAFGVTTQTSGPFCAGASVTLTATGNTNMYGITLYRWQKHNGSTWADIATTSTVSVSAAGTYRATATSGGCTAISTELVLTPLANTKPTISGSGNQCTQGFLTLTATAGSSYRWSNGATTRSTSGYPGGTYYVTVTNANGCSNISNTYTVQSCTPTDPCASSLAVGQYKPPIPPCENPSSITSKASIYPNPSDDELTIFMPQAAEENGTVKLYSSIGQLLISSVLPAGSNSITMNTSDLADGICVLHVALKGKPTFTSRVLISHKQ